MTTRREARSGDISRSPRLLLKGLQAFYISRWVAISVVSISVLWAALSLPTSVGLYDEYAVVDGIVIASLSWPVVVLLCASIVLITLFVLTAILERNVLSNSELDGTRPHEERIVYRAAASLNQTAPELSKLPHSQDVCWQQYEAPSDGHLVGRILCVGSAVPYERMACLARNLISTRSSVDLINDFEGALEIISAWPDVWKLLIVDVDYVEKSLDLDDIVRELVSFRENCSSCAIALVSISFSSNDGSLIRSYMADYSFRATVSDERIIETLPEVFENHKKFVNRRRLHMGPGNVITFSRNGQA